MPSTGRVVNTIALSLSREDVLSVWCSFDPSRDYVDCDDAIAGVEWRCELNGDSGVLYRGERIPVTDGLVFTVDMLESVPQDVTNGRMAGLR